MTPDAPRDISPLPDAPMDDLPGPAKGYISQAAITAASLALLDAHVRFGIRLNADDRRAIAESVVEAALPHLLRSRS